MKGVMAAEVRLKDRVGLVTGAGRGMGRAISLALAAEGCAVALGARTEAQLRAVATTIQGMGSKALPVVTDVTVEDQVEKLFHHTMDTFGRLDILVNCAGVGRFAPIVDMSTSDWDMQIDVNLRGVFLCCREALRCMIPRGSGHIINIASGAARTGYPNMSGYCASKFGLMGFSQVLAQEGREHNIKVTVILPGRTDTGFSGSFYSTGERELVLKPEDVARAVVEVVSYPDRALVSELALKAFLWREGSGG